MRVIVRSPSETKLIKRDGLGWGAEGALWVEGDPGERHLRRSFGRRLKG